MRPLLTRQPLKKQPLMRPRLARPLLKKQGRTPPKVVLLRKTRKTKEPKKKRPRSPLERLRAVNKEASAAAGMDATGTHGAKGRETARPRGTGRRPQRTCIGCRGVFDRTALIRVSMAGGRPTVDTSNRAGGRGAYICRKKECLEAAFRKKGAFSRAFRRRVESKDLDALHEKLESVLEGRHDGGAPVEPDKRQARNKPDTEDKRSI